MIQKTLLYMEQGAIIDKKNLRKNLAVSRDAASSRYSEGYLLIDSTTAKEEEK